MDRMLKRLVPCMVLYLVATLAHADSYTDGLRWLKAKSYGRAAAAFRQAATSGNAAAERELGFMYYNGNGFALNTVRALAWFERAALHGDVDSQMNLGKMYENGLSVRRDETQAAKWYLMAAERGQRFAQFRMGEIAYMGAGVERDRAEAVKWFTLALQADDDVARSMRATAQPVIDKLPADTVAEGRRRANEWTAARLTYRGG